VRVIKRFNLGHCGEKFPHLPLRLLPAPNLIHDVVFDLNQVTNLKCRFGTLIQPFFPSFLLGDHFSFFAHVSVLL